MKAKKIVALVLALVMVLALGTSALAATGDMSNPVTAAGLTLHFGDPKYPPTDPECNMYFKETATNTYDAIYSTDGATASTSFYPSILAFYVDGTVTSITGTDIDFVTYDQETGAETISSTVAVNADGFYTIKPKSSSSKIVLNGSVTVNFSTPISATAAAGSIAKAVCGYLPVGQFARYNSFGWGTIFTDNTNVYDSSKQAKFVSATGEGTSYIATGVSLGMAGGYVQFDMGTDENGADRLITNNPNNKYGIDFIVYGNAFVGNPEAGIVKVSQDGTKWYTLAGSRHYMAGTEWNQNISYVRLTAANTALNSKFTKAGIYVSTNFAVPASDNADAVNAAIGAATWTGVAQLTGNTYPKTLSTANPAPAAWWPEWTNDASGNAENYGQVWKINGDSDLSDVSWLRSGSAEVITYKNVTTVEDDMVVLNKTLSAAPTQAQMTDVYQWGYADVRPNAPSGADAVYGQAVNPYAVAASSTTEASGDGFDLSWAVDDNGLPVSLEGVRYIRVYSGVLFSAGVFGETSTEVCGLYVANSAGAGAATAVPSVSAGKTATTLTTVTTTNQGTSNVKVGNARGVIKIESAAEHIFVNGVEFTSGDTLTLTGLTTSTAKTVQIVTQNGTESPYVTVLKVTR